MTAALPGLATVLLFCSDAERDEYISALQASGYASACIPVIDTQACNSSQLDEVSGPAIVLQVYIAELLCCRAQVLHRLHGYAAIALTSQHAANILRNCATMRSEVHKAVAALRCFVIGNKSAQTLASLDLPNVHVADSSGATALADLLVSFRSEFSPGKPILFLCGSKRLDVLPAALTAQSMAFEEVVVYETHSADATTISDRIGTSLAGGDAIRTIVAVFFSPSCYSAVSQTSAFVSLTAQSEGNRMRTVAFGSTTANAIRATGGVVDAVCASQNPEGVVVAVRSCVEDR
jgi:uroporphyrinogen-III synthase